MFIQNCIQNISKNQEDLEMSDLISIIIPVYNAGKTMCLVKDLLYITTGALW